MIEFEEGFDLSAKGIVLIARVHGRRMPCWVTSEALLKKECITTADMARLRKLFKKYEPTIKNRISEKISLGAAEQDRTFRLNADEL